MTRPRADLTYETALRQQGFTHIAGLDEVGRGAWAGPVVAGAVILPLDRPDLAQVLEGVNDSKLLSPRRREKLLLYITEAALAMEVGFATQREIDKHGIVTATRLAMQRALARLPIQPDCLLLDALRLPSIALPQTHLIRGDQKSLTIAAASIVAKVTRDQWMRDRDEHYPEYGFAAHKGYGTALHQRALQQYGVTELHRRSFAPIRAAAAQHHTEWGT